MNTLTSLKMVGAILKDAAAFEERKPITVDVPEAVTEADLSEFGIGKVKVIESNLRVTITKLP